MRGEVTLGEDGVARCWWGAAPAAYVRYHDEEWGFPVDDDRLLFEKLCLEGFQAGLSWLTVLRKRAAFREAFHGFDLERVARLTDADVTRLLGDDRIIRHRGKIESTINNARRALELADEFGSLGAFVWAFEPEEPTKEPVAVTEESRALARELKRRGFSFVGPTTVYAFMQAMGIVDDHVDDCDIREAAERSRAAFARPKLTQPILSR